MSDRWFENTFWNTLEIIQTNATYATMHPLKQSTWGRKCKHTAEISQTNATYVTMQLCKPTIGNLRAHLKIHRRYIVKQVLLYVALIASCKHLCNRIDCKSEFIPMSAFLYVWHHWTSMNRFELTHLALQFDFFMFGSERCFQTFLGWHFIVTNVALDIMSFMYSLHVEG